MYTYGIHPVEELLEIAPERIIGLYAADPQASQLEGIVALAEGHDLRVQRRGRQDLDRMAEGANHQGVVAETRPFEYASLDALLASVDGKSRACLVVLDQVQDPRNLGAILRSAAAFGVDGVIIARDRQAGVTPAAIRASAGQAWRVPVAQVTNIARTLDELKEHGFWTLGAMVDADSQPIWQVDLDMKCALVLGGEGPGIRRLVGEKCDFRVLVPMAPGVESLNVASAASIFLFEVRRQWAINRSASG